MATTSFSNIDEYGFERPNNFNYGTPYLKVLSIRNLKWNNLLKNNKTPSQNRTLKRYIRKGIPREYRKDMWMYVSSAEAMMKEKPDLYSLLRNTPEINPKKNIIESIRIDIPRTFPENIYFSKSDGLPLKLYNVLVAYAYHNTEVGYCQGLNYIVGLLLIVTNCEQSSFWLLKCLVERILPKYYIKTMSGLITEIEVLNRLISIKEPQVYEHLKIIGVPLAVITTKWFVCLFSEVLPTETVLRIWDCLFNEGSKILFRVALTLIRVNKEKILECPDLPSVINCFKSMVTDPYVVKCHEFMQDIFKVPGSLSYRDIENLRRELTGVNIQN